jgi:hypothetical protein
MEYALNLKFCFALYEKVMFIILLIDINELFGLVEFGVISFGIIKVKTLFALICS